MKVMIATHDQQMCGIFQYGTTLMMPLSKSKVHEYIWAPCGNPYEFMRMYDSIRPEVVIYNYHPSPLGWAHAISPSLVGRSKQLAIIHEHVLPPPPNMDGYISLDPSTPETESMFSPGWFILDYENKYPEPETPTFGSFGFGLPGKGFERMVELVQNEYDEAIIRLGIAYAYYGDADGSQARAVAQRCRDIIKKPGIVLDIHHELLEVPQLLDWLAQNSMNVFLYDFFGGRGLSSVPIYSVSSRRPIAMTKSFMFRHVYEGSDPSCFIEDRPFKDILQSGTKALDSFYTQRWSEEEMARRYDNIINRITGT